MIRACLHTHSTLCDGRAPLEEYPEAALRQGLTLLGFSGHAPVPYDNDWTMKRKDLPEYVQRVRTLKELYAGKLEILLGMELDWLPEAPEAFLPDPSVAGYDYRIGSVHSMMDPADGRFYAVDGPEEELVHLRDGVFGGSYRKLTEEYTRRLTGMIRRGGFEILGHIDLIRKRNRDGKYFDEGESWYRQVYGSVLEELSARPEIVVELNTGAIARGYLETPYPAPWLLTELHNRKIPVMINADAHEPDKLTFWYDQAERLLTETGFRTVRLPVGGVWKEYPLGEG